LTGLTSDPALYGRPTAFQASGPQFAAGALVNHVRSIPVDTAGATVGGIRLPAFEIPGVPLRLDPGAATTQLGFTLNGDTIHARFAIRSNECCVGRARLGGGIHKHHDRRSDLADRVRHLESRRRSASLGALQSSGPGRAVESRPGDRVAIARGASANRFAAAEKQVRDRVDALITDKVGPVRARV